MAPGFYSLVLSFLSCLSILGFQASLGCNIFKEWFISTVHVTPPYRGRSSVNMPTGSLLFRPTVLTKHIAFCRDSSWKVSTGLPAHCLVFKALPRYQVIFLKCPPSYITPSSAPSGVPQSVPKLLIWFSLTHLESLLFQSLPLPLLNLQILQLSLLPRSPCGFWCFVIDDLHCVDTWLHMLVLFPQCMTGLIWARAFFFVLLIPVRLA